MNQFDQFIESPQFHQTRDALIQAVLERSKKVSARRLEPTSPQARQKYLDTLKDFQIRRGRDLYFPYLMSGLGSGPFVEMADGTVKYDMITGIGINFFGHSHPEIMKESLTALASDPWQGNLQPGREADALLMALLSRVEKNSKLRRGWLTTCGTMANEIALKIIRQKKSPATKIIAFQDCFCGRSTAMQEITDNPSYRVGQPLYGEVLYLPFYDNKKSLSENIQIGTAKLSEHLAQFGDKIAALMMEPVQGEGGFNYAPREWYVALFEVAKKAGLYIWLDEIQTVGRTGELFAFQKLNLGEYVDVVTAAKMLQSSVALYTEELNPKPGLVSGTFAGTSATLRLGRRILELLDETQCFGTDGRTARVAARFQQNLEKLKNGSCSGKIKQIRIFGGMIAFEPFDGKLDQVKAVLMKLFDLGVVAFYAGHDPYLVRMLPPVGILEPKHIDEVCQVIEQALMEVSVT